MTVVEVHLTMYDGNRSGIKLFQPDADVSGNSPPGRLDELVGERSYFSLGSDQESLLEIGTWVFVDHHVDLLLSSHDFPRN